MCAERRSGTKPTDSADVGQVYDRLLAGAAVSRRVVEVVGHPVHLLEDGAGPPLVLLHGTTAAAGMFLPLLNEFHGLRAIAPDRPGHGLSDPIHLPRRCFSENAVAWIDALLDRLELETTALLGHSGGAVWALWYALARPVRISRLVLLGPPALPGTRCAFPLRLVVTPGVGALISRLAPPTPKSVLRFAGAMHEKATLAGHPDLVDLFVATGRDSSCDRTGREELRVFISPAALLTPSGWRRDTRLRAEELHRVRTPTLVIWGADEPLGKPSVARAAVELMPQGRLDVLPGGHAPWLGHAALTATTVEDFVRGEASTSDAAVVSEARQRCAGC